MDSTQVDFHDAFLSYARVDAASAEALRAALEMRGLRVWKDTHDLPDAAPWRDEIAQALDRSSAAIFLLTPAWAGSPNCRAELREAVARRKRLLPVRAALLSPEARTGIDPELSDLNDIDAEQGFGPELVERIAAQLRADPEWDRLRRQLLTLARMWESHDHDDARLARGQALEAARAALIRSDSGQQPALSDLERLFVQRSVQAATEEEAHEREMRRRAFARRAVTVRSLVTRVPQTALALAAAVWRAADTHETRAALAETLIALHPLHVHLARADGHVGHVRDLSFVGNDALASVDDGSIAINDERPGRLCLWDVAEGTLLKADTRLAATSVAAPDANRVVVARGQELYAVRWYDDEDRFGFRARWQLAFEAPIDALAYSPDSDLLAVAVGSEVVILRDGDRAIVRPGWRAPGDVSALAWIDGSRLAMACGTTLCLLPINGDAETLDVGVRIGALASAGGRFALVLGAALCDWVGKTFQPRARLPQRGPRFAIARVPGVGTAAAGGIDGPDEAALMLYRDEEPIGVPLFRGVRHGFGRLAASPHGRWIAAAEGDADPHPVVRVWDLHAPCPLPLRKLVEAAAFDRACALVGGPGFAAASGSRIEWRDSDGSTRRQIELGSAIVDLTSTETGIVALCADGQAHSFAADGTQQPAASLVAGEGDAAVRLMPVTPWRYLATFASGRVRLYDATRQLLAEARLHRAEVLGHVTDCKDPVDVAGAVGWTDSPWVLLQPKLGKAGVSGFGWWDTRGDSILWTGPGSFTSIEAPLLRLPDGRVLAAADLDAVIYEPRFAADDSAAPELLESVRHDMSDPPRALLGADDSRPLVACCYRRLLLLSSTEATAIARFSVPEDFRALTLADGGNALIVFALSAMWRLSLDPADWAALAERKAGRTLTPDERRRYLPETVESG